MWMRGDRTVYARIGKKGLLVHRLLAERALGRPLPKGAEVHHVDGDTMSPSPRLVICQDRTYHRLLHWRAMVIRAGGDPALHSVCKRCYAAKPFAMFKRQSKNRTATSPVRTWCKQCDAAYRRECRASDAPRLNKRRTLTEPHTVEAIRSALQSGVTMHAVARQFGVTVVTIWSFKKRHGLQEGT